MMMFEMSTQQRVDLISNLHDNEAVSEVLRQIMMKDSDHLEFEDLLTLYIVHGSLSPNVHILSWMTTLSGDDIVDDGEFQELQQILRDNNMNLTKIKGYLAKTESKMQKLAFWHGNRQDDQFNLAEQYKTFEKRQRTEIMGNEFTAGSTGVHCDICNVRLDYTTDIFSQIRIINVHKNGEKHMKNAAKKKEDIVQ